MKFTLLQSDGNDYLITKKVRFGERLMIKPCSEAVLQALQFAYNMTAGQQGEHRKNRSGGDEVRNSQQIFCDVFVGKMGEFTFYSHFSQRPQVQDLSPVDLQCERLGRWDSSDFILDTNNKRFNIAVKSTKHFGNLLLLEERDWSISTQQQAIYLPNENTLDKGIYDYLFFCRVKCDIESIIKQHNHTTIFTKKENNINTLREIKEDLISNLQTDIVGYISNADLYQLITNRQLLPKDSWLNRKTKMDASNFYIQSGDFRTTNIQ